MNSHFDNQAKDWDNDPEKNERAIVIAKEIDDFIKPNKKLDALEFGCGTGLLSFQLRDSFKTITLADSSDGMIKVLKEKILKSEIKNFKPLLINNLEKDLKTNSFDVIYTLMTLHHMIDLNQIAKSFNSLLNENGYLCIADLVKEDGSFHANHKDFDGHNGFDKEELSKLLIKNGFEIAHYNISFKIKKNVNGKKKTYPLFLMICKKS